jgi:hypothetical protein
VYNYIVYYCNGLDNCSVLYCTVLYCTVLLCSVFDYCIVQYYIFVLYCIGLVESIGLL